MRTASITLGSGETFTQNGMTFTIDSITLSPVAYKVDYTVDSEVDWSDSSGSGRQSEEDSRQMERYFENVEILLTLTDGTVVDLSNAGGSIGPEDGVTVCSKGEMFSAGHPHGGHGQPSPWAAWCSPSPRSKSVSSRRVRTPPGEFRRGSCVLRLLRHHVGRLHQIRQQLLGPVHVLRPHGDVVGQPVDLAVGAEVPVVQLGAAAAEPGASVS